MVEGVQQGPVLVGTFFTHSRGVCDSGFQPTLDAQRESS